MRKLFLTLTLLSLANLVFSQKITYKKGVVYKDGEKYALIKKKGNIISGINYSIQTINGEEVAYTRNVIESRDGHEIIFKKSGQKGFMRSNITFAKMLGKALVQSDVINVNGINPEGEQKFLQLNPNETQNQVNVTVNNKVVLNYQTVERNREADITAYNGSIEQDFKKIGKIQKNTGQNTSYQVFLPDGMKIAEGRFSNEGSFKLVTLKDNREHIISLDEYDVENEQKIAKYLSDRYYL